MDIGNLFRFAVQFYHQYTVIALALLIAIAIFVFMKPKQALKVAIFALIIGVLFYIISLLNQSMFSGVGHKDKIIKRSRDAIELNQ